MKILKSSYKILLPRNLNKESAKEILMAIEEAGRTCYKSEDKITEESASKFVKMLIRKGHESVLEHRTLSVRFIFDRGVSHEIVRHRLSSFSQESTRFCDYGHDKFNKQISVIDITQHLRNPESLKVWEEAMWNAEKSYMKLLELGETAQIARSVLPNSLKTEIIVTCNMREWREIFRQRAAAAAHPQMREIMIPLLAELTDFLPELFGDIQFEQKNK